MIKTGQRHFELLIMVCPLTGCFGSRYGGQSNPYSAGKKMYDMIMYRLDRSYGNLVGVSLDTFSDSE